MNPMHGAADSSSGYNLLRKSSWDTPQSLSITLKSPTRISFAGTVTYTVPLVSVTWLPFCRMALKP